MLSKQVRETFLNYFEDRGHQRVESASLIPLDDPTLLFTNAGMVPFKDLFTGNVKRGYTRATSSQRCVRASGKHNDLEEVGYTRRHQTMFEMLGNFSFGDYFKSDAIAWAWELSTKVYGLDINRLWVSVYSEDDEAFELWKKVGVKPDRILRFGDKDNFWAMGDIGPCGPCSEIHYDLGEELGTGPEDVVNGSGDRFLEFYNLVFMQYETKVDGSRIELPKPSIDTGMGLERMTSILQGKTSNYETDLLVGLVDSMRNLVGKTELNNEQQLVACQVIADHIRCASLLIADGILPSNLGRGYVLRRILRRAIRYSYQLGLKDPVLYELVPQVVNILGEAHPIFGNKTLSIQESIKREESGFLRTVHKGLEMLETEVNRSRGEKSTKLSAEVIFKLYDTFGFPRDLSEVILRDKGMAFDAKGFDLLMEEQRERARANQKFGKDLDWETQIISEGNGDNFIGYESLKCTAKALKLFISSSSEWVKIVLNKTPFYAESGGQVGDQGWISNRSIKLRVLDTQKEEGEIVHICELESGHLDLSEDLLLSVDSDKRRLTTRNHTAVHMLQGVLREKFGESIQQAGSYVDHVRFRFDFTFDRGLNPNEIRDVETELFERINGGRRVLVHLKSLDEARQMGAICPFGEKYGELVRVVDVPDFSMEFCGGCHVNDIFEIGMVKVTSESSISAGVRRIEGVTGRGAFELFQEENSTVDKITRQLKQKGDLVTLVQGLQDNLKTKSKELDKLKQELNLGKMDSMYAEMPKIGELSYLQANFEGLDSKTFRALSDQAIQKIGSGVLVLFNDAGQKVSLICKVSEDWVAKGLDAGKVVSELAQILGGRGGGRKNMAQAGGNEPHKIPQAMQKTPELLKSMLGE